MTLRRWLFAALVLVVATGVARAEVYVGASAGRAKLNDEDPAFDFAGTDTSYKVFGGFRFFKLFGVEGSYIDLGSAGDTLPILGDVTIETTGWDAFAVGALPIGAHFEVFGKAGLVYWENEVNGTIVPTSTDSGIDLAYGVGFDIKFTKHLGVRAEYERFDVGDIDRLFMTSVGIDLRF